jgi:hypothetical protein
MGLVLVASLGGLVPSGSLAADDRRPGKFYVAGAYEPRDGQLSWRKGYWAEVQPGWRWVPAGWVRLRSGWGFQPGFWKSAVRSARVAPSGPGKPITVIMPGPGMPEVNDAAPTFVPGDPEQFAGRVVGPILAPSVVNSKDAMDHLVDRPIDWNAIAARRARLTAMLGWSAPVYRPAAPMQPPAVNGSILPMSPAYYIGNALPGTNYASYSLTPPGSPGQATYVGNSLPGTSYPSYSFSPSPVPGQSFYIGNSLPGTSYPTYSPEAAGSVGGYGYGTAPPGNTAGQSPVR